MLVKQKLVRNVKVMQVENQNSAMGIKGNNFFLFLSNTVSPVFQFLLCLQANLDSTIERTHSINDSDIVDKILDCCL